MSKPRDDKTAGGTFNWDPPSKRDLVERAVSDGITDPAEIVKWARSREVVITVDEVIRLKAELSKSEPRQPSA